MSMVATESPLRVERRWGRLLDARLCIGCQFGVPVEITFRQALRQAPCLFLMAGLIALAVFL